MMVSENVGDHRDWQPTFRGAKSDVTRRRHRCVSETRWCSRSATARTTQEYRCRFSKRHAPSAGRSSPALTGSTSVRNSSAPSAKRSSKCAPPNRLRSPLSRKSWTMRTTMKITKSRGRRRKRRRIFAAMTTMKRATKIRRCGSSSSGCSYSSCWWGGFFLVRKILAERAANAGTQPAGISLARTATQTSAITLVAVA